VVDLPAAGIALASMLGLAALAWLVSVKLRDASIVDSFWSIFFLAGLLAYVVVTGNSGARTLLILVIVTVWALRLSIYLTWRNWGEPEDRRYQAIRARNEPGFAWKSLYLVFGLQAVLAATISMPLLAAAHTESALSWIDYTGFGLWLAGFGFESVADWQLARFKAQAANRDKVLRTGLWRYSRHPNYFGEALLWWGYYLIAVSAGGAWTVFAPVLMTYLLLRVSGVSLLEQDIGERRPDYRDYTTNTNAFVPGRPRTA